METADGICDRVSFIVDGKLVLTDTPRNLKSIYGKEAVTVELKNGQSEEFLLKDLGVNAQFLDFIKQDEVKRIHTLEATLEEVFIRVTGKSLGDE
jgi:fluoroquinolone transport system ATP-binding protein